MHRRWVGHVATTLAVVLLAVAVSSAQQAHIVLDWSPHKDTRHLVPFMAGVISPEVTDDGMVTFRVAAPKAQEVLLSAGTIHAALGSESKPWPFTRGSDGTWTLRIGPIPPNLYVYKLLIDGASVADPANTIGGVGNQPVYSTLVVHGKGPAYYDAQPVPHGALTRHVYRSNVLDGERELYVYTPPGYDRNKTYPVLYLLGGSGETAAGWWLDGRATFIADNLLAEGKAVPMIIVMPNNQVVHRSDPRHAEVTFDLPRPRRPRQRSSTARTSGRRGATCCTRICCPTCSGQRSRVGSREAGIGSRAEAGTIGRTMP